jgi:hypothetical protein
MLVSVRIRPLNKKELQYSSLKTLQIENDKIKIISSQKQKEIEFEFDFIFSEEITQKEIYEYTTEKLINKVMEGFNATVFAFGATGSGKTYTMVGNNKESGIMIRSINDLFLKLNNEKNKDYSVHISYIEVYNEQLKDLLNFNNENNNLISNKINNNNKYNNIENNINNDNSKNDDNKNNLEKNNNIETDNIEQEKENKNEDNNNENFNINVNDIVINEEDNKENIEKNNNNNSNTLNNEKENNSINTNDNNNNNNNEEFSNNNIREIKGIQSKSLKDLINKKK